MGRKSQHKSARMPHVADTTLLSASWPWAAWLVGAMAVLVYANTFTHGFTLDDVPIIEENHLIRSLRNLPEMFRTNYWGLGDKPSDRSLYRPLTIASYAINYALHGLNPVGYHIVNVLLHALVSVLLFRLVRRLFGSEPVALMAGVLFAVHPIHTEAVAGVVGRAEILALGGVLLCCLGYENARRAARDNASGRMLAWMCVSVAGYLGGMFSKEIGVIAPAVIVLSEWLRPDQRWLLRFEKPAWLAGVALLAAFGVFMMMRQRAILTRNISLGFLGVPVEDRVWTALRVCLEYVGLLIAPVRLSADYWKSDVPVATSPLEPGTFATLVLLGVTVMLAFRYARKAPMVFWGIGFFLIALLPVSNLVFAIGVMKAERILYAPSAGFVVALAGLLAWRWDHARFRRAGIWLAIALAAGYAVRTWMRNPVWQNNWVLAQATLQTSPQSPLFHNIIAQEYRKQKPPNNIAARDHLQRSVAQNPLDASVFFNLGNTHLDLGEYEDAIRCFQEALKLTPNAADYLLNLGMTYYRMGEFEKAAAVFARVRQIRPHTIGPWLNEVSAYVQLKQPARALPVAEEAARRFARDAGVWLNLAVVYEQLGRSADMQAALVQAEKLDPNIRRKIDRRARME